MPHQTLKLPWLEPGDPFPPLAEAWGPESDAPGLLAVGGNLDVPTLLDAYGNGIFPWFSEGQPNLWWSTDPRMVLTVANFRLHRSLRKVLTRFVADPRCEIHFDTAFSDVINACATTPRNGHPGTWILPSMVHAYTEMNKAGHAHSVETWVDGRLVGGLYCVGLGRAVFGESMFALASDTSKIALAALVCFCRAHAIPMIDCQQNTAHLASLGASEMPRAAFLAQIRHNQRLPSPEWRFSPLYWDYLLSA